MIEHDQILLLIMSFALFFQGFSFRRRHVSIMLISSLIMLSISGLSVMLNGTGVYSSALSNVDIYGVTIAIAYVLFWWISGYIIGGFRRRKDKENICSKCKIGENECGNN